jgi:hypothetical protein
MALACKFGVEFYDVRSADCTAGEAIGDFVYVSAAPVAGQDQVRVADPTDAAKVPAIGVIISKPTSTTCRVQWGGISPALFSGLNAGSVCFLDRDASPTETPPSPSGDNVYVQALGISFAADRVLIDPDLSMTLRNA